MALLDMIKKLFGGVKKEEEVSVEAPAQEEVAEEIVEEASAEEVPAKK
jgi:hypothetical protein